MKYSFYRSRIATYREVRHVLQIDGVINNTFYAVHRLPLLDSALWANVNVVCVWHVRWKRVIPDLGPYRNIW